MIAIMDWGIGGMDCYKQIVEQFPQAGIIYFSDAGFIPYGKVSTQQLADRVRTVAEFLHEQGATHLVVACNAASTVLPKLGVIDAGTAIEFANGSLFTTGIISHGIEMVRRAKLKKVGVVGGARTIRSLIYRDELRRSGIDDVRQRIAQPLSAWIEEGRGDTVEALQELRRIVGPLRDVEGLLLACTHYPALREHFAKELTKTKLLDPVEELMKWIRRSWRKAIAGKVGRPRFFTTGDEGQMIFAASKAFAVQLAGVEKVTLGTNQSQVGRVEPSAKRIPRAAQGVSSGKRA